MSARMTELIKSSAEVMWEIQDHAMQKPPLLGRQAVSAEGKTFDSSIRETDAHVQHRGSHL